MAALPPVLLIGCGRMGSALVRGWQKLDPAADIRTVNPGPIEVQIPHYRHAGEIPPDFAPQLVVVAVKPQKIAEVLPAYVAYAQAGAVFVSIAAGTTLATMGTLLGAAPIVRAMPNTPASIGAGISVCVANVLAQAPAQKLATLALQAVGQVEWVQDEGLMDAVTALSGSGPAYVFYLTEVLAAAGTKLGLPPDMAMRLARQMVVGSAQLMAQSPEGAAQLREAVTSPNGTTAAALAVLAQGTALQQLFDAALLAASQRSQALAH